jgi:hypothetical protein
MWRASIYLGGESITHFACNGLDPGKRLGQVTVVAVATCCTFWVEVDDLIRHYGGVNPLYIYPIYIL